MYLGSRNCGSGPSAILAFLRRGDGGQADRSPATNAKTPNTNRNVGQSRASRSRRASEPFPIDRDTGAETELSRCSESERAAPGPCYSLNHSPFQVRRPIEIEPHATAHTCTHHQTKKGRHCARHVSFRLVRLSFCIFQFMRPRN